MLIPYEEQLILHMCFAGRMLIPAASGELAVLCSSTVTKSDALDMPFGVPEGLTYEAVKPCSLTSHTL